MQRKKVFGVAAGIFAAMVSFVPSLGAAVIFSEAYGAAGQWYPLPADVQGMDHSPTDQVIVRNGDFFIDQRGAYIPDPVTAPNDQYHNRGYMVGDGINENTNWVFDFTRDARYARFDLLQPLTAARFTITLLPMGAGVDFYSDGFRIKWLEQIRLTDVDADSVNAARNLVPVVFTVDLLQYYTSDDILGLLRDDEGVLNMRYVADAYVRQSSLELSNEQANPVPEPAGVLLLGPALAGLFLRKRTRR